MSNDLLGPGDADNAVTVRPTRTITRGATDTWFKDCSSETADDGTEVPADFENDMLAQLRTAIRGSAVDAAGEDDMLWRAIESVGVRTGDDTSSSAAHIVADLSPVPLKALTKGKLVIVWAAHDCVGATDFAPDGLTAKAIKWPDGSALATNDYKNGCGLLLAYTGAFWQLIFKLNNASGAPPNPYLAGVLYLFTGDTAPSGTLIPDGAEYLRADYPNLLAAWGGPIYGARDSAHFYMPNWSGMFPRLMNRGSGRDPDVLARTDRGDGTTGDHVGTLQGYAVKIDGPFKLLNPYANIHTVFGTTPPGTQADVDIILGSGVLEVPNLPPLQQPPYLGFTDNSNWSPNTAASFILNYLWGTPQFPNAGNETRPKNFYALPCIGVG